MKKILIFGMSSTVGGVENFILQLYRKIDKSNLQIDFVVTEGLNGYYKDVLESYNAKIYVIPSIKKHYFKCIKEIKKIINKENYDVMHVNFCSAQMFLYAYYFKKFAKKDLKIITHSHSSGETDIIRKLLHYLIRPLIIKKTDYFISCSKVAGEWMFTKRIANSKKLIIIKNAIDINRFKYDKNKRAIFRKKYNLNECLVIGHIGRFEKVKNHEFMIMLFKEYLTRNKNTRLVLVGEGSLKNDVKKKVKEFGIEKYVVFINETDKVDLIYNGIDVFILPSLFEGLPIVGIEAQVAALPCVFSNNITKELDISNNCYFEELNVSKWINCIDSIANKKSQRITNKEKIKESGYDIDTEIEKIRKLYMEA